MNYVQVLYSGGWGEAAAVVDNGGNLTLSNSVVSNSYTAGLRITQANPTISGDTFLNNYGVAISIDLASNPSTSSVTATGNSVNGVVVDSGSLAANLFLTGQDVNYLLAGSVTIPQGITLSIGGKYGFLGRGFRQFPRRRHYRQRRHLLDGPVQQRLHERLSSTCQHGHGERRRSGTA